MDGRNMSEKLPDAFVERMRQQLGDEMPAFLSSLEETPARGIRLNPLKPTKAALRYTEAGSVPWETDGYMLPGESDAGSTILHAAGAFYIQEPGAMLPARVLDARPGEKILDLCAAPGGKTTQIGCAMRGEGLLVCNEPVPKRAQILSGNIERMGLPNTIVICEMPCRLAEKWPEGFDAVLVDAPCSGEGMFRRNPETRKEWTAAKAEGCAARQREILSAAAGLVRPGGRLVYSTCTYNPSENEENVRWFTGQYPAFHPEGFFIPGINAPDGMFTCYPHRLQGEGQFAALLRKDGEGTAFLPADRSLPKPDKTESKLFSSAFPSLPEPTHLFGKVMISMPEMPEVKGIRIFRAGLHLGEIRGKAAIPDHAAALCFRTSGIQAAELNADEAVRYASGEIIPGESAGWTMMRWKGLTIGWGKGSEGMIKNHYPKALRNQKLIP